MHFTRNVILPALILAVVVSAGLRKQIWNLFEKIQADSEPARIATVAPAPLAHQLHYDPYTVYKEYVFPIFEIDTDNVQRIEDFTTMIQENNQIRRKCLLAMHSDKKTSRQRQFLAANPQKTETDLWEVDLASDLMAFVVYDTDHTGENYKEIIQQLTIHHYFDTRPQFQRIFTEEQLHDSLAKLGLKTENGPPVQKELDRIRRQAEAEKAERERERIARKKIVDENNAKFKKRVDDMVDEG